MGNGPCAYKLICLIPLYTRTTTHSKIARCSIYYWSKSVLYLFLTSLALSIIVKHPKSTGPKVYEKLYNFGSPVELQYLPFALRTMLLHCRKVYRLEEVNCRNLHWHSYLDNNKALSLLYYIDHISQLTLVPVW